ncbi:MAG: methionyl-tRNA formyltransferase [Planctomycetales bacterium]|nr:methionyl-tRNA formyltransferase [Planctomycetales bacterium]
MRLVVMGTGGFSVPMFRALLDSPHEVVAVITRPVPSISKGKAPPPNPMYEETTKLDLPVFMPARINDPVTQQMLSELAADLFVVCDYGQILSAETLQLARLGGINLHGSLLPAYRGAAPINWCLYDGCDETGVTVIHMTPRLDAGPSLVQRSLSVSPAATAAEIEESLALLGVEPVLEAIAMLERWDGEASLGVPQDRARATKAPRLTKQDGQVNWQRSAVQISNQVRAFQPWPGTFTFWQRHADKPPIRLVLDAVHAVTADEAASGDGGQLPGQVVQSDKSLQVATGDGLLQIDRIQPAGKRVQSAAEFLRGYPLPVGEVLGS